MILAFDTETTGFVNKHISLDHPSQPHLLELGAVLCEDDGRERASLSLIVRPDGDDFEVPAEVAAIHGLTTEIVRACGVPTKTAIVMLSHLWERADTLVAYNLPFDKQIIDIAIIRGKIAHLPKPARRVCAMELATPVLNLPATERMHAVGWGHKPKPPSLQEAHTALLGEAFSGAHGALTDARACARVFFKLREMGHVVAT